MLTWFAVLVLALLVGYFVFMSFSVLCPRGRIYMCINAFTTGFHLKEIPGQGTNESHPRRV